MLRTVCVIGLVVVASVASASGAVHRVLYQAGGRYLHVEVLDDDLVHFEVSAVLAVPAVGTPIYTTPMVAKTDYTGPANISDSGAGVLETDDLRITVDPSTLCVTVVDTTQPVDVTLTTICPFDLELADKGLRFTAESMRNVYGLGEQLRQPGVTDGDWMGSIRTPGNFYGNAQVGFNGGAVGNDQFPIMYAVGNAYENYAVFADHLYAQTWSFVGDPWEMRTQGSAIRWYVMGGASLPDLRSDYMELTGRPPVPPKKGLGLWISEYGFDNWTELESKIATLRANAFPVDGFVLDLQWFGNVQGNSESSQMGSLTWDTWAFPNPAQKIADLRANDGVGIIQIEESYVSRGLPVYATMQSQGYLPLSCSVCGPVYMSEWWGAGSMIDWTNPAGSDYWHDTKRQPLIDAGVLGHWTDLGEPENFDPGAWYYGFPSLGLRSHQDIHNAYNLLGLASIDRGYTRNGVVQRPFTVSRSGTSGIQRYGVAMWSGDIGSNLGSFAAHLNTQMHMSMSGVDYYGADIGGFHRGSVDGDTDEMYTIWFANGMAFDVPGRPHTENLCNCKETAPDRIGNQSANLANLRQRYTFAPYMYSLAHRAYLYGEPVVPPLFFYYQNDLTIRETGDVKMLGRDVLVAAIAQYGQTQRNVYLPAGTWINYHTGAWTDSVGEEIAGVSTYPNGLFTLPMFVRAGAVIPQMYVDSFTMNIVGKRTDASTRDELIVRVYGDSTLSSFRLYEDDGETIAYKSGAVRTTDITQQQIGSTATVTIGAAIGTYAGALAARDNVVRLSARGASGAMSVTLNGVPLTEYVTQGAFDTASGGWFYVGSGVVLAKSGDTSIATQKQFVFSLFIDCNGNGISDALDIASTFSDDCDTNGVPDECQPDCNGNSIADICDIATGFSDDCNGNGQPDDCDIVSALSGDCNSNGVPDTCDISGGILADSDGDGIPDICEPPAVFVDGDATGQNNGVSWANAFTDLQDALAFVRNDASVEAIWVAAGTYTPAGPMGNRWASFDLVDGVRMYGGFGGWEASLDQRDVLGNPTVLSGDLNGNDVPGFGGNWENSYHIVRASGTGPSTRLDGFFLRGGNANADGWPDNAGGAIRNDTGSPIIVNCTFVGNAGRFSGAVDNASQSNGQFSKCMFFGNKADFGGAAVSVFSNSSPVFRNCVFSGNNSDGDGGAVRIGDNANPQFVNCSFRGNDGARGGGLDIASGNATLTNCVLWNNTADSGSVADAQLSLSGGSANVRFSTVQDNTAGDGSVPFGGAGNDNIDLDPAFANPLGPDGQAGTTDDDLHLGMASPCIDVGDPAYSPSAETTDLDGHAPILCGRVDMGAYESGAGDYNCDRSADLGDLAGWSACMTGPEGGPYGSGCEALDLQFDGDVDVADFSAFMMLLGGP